MARNLHTRLSIRFAWLLLMTLFGVGCGGPRWYHMIHYHGPFDAFADSNKTYFQSQHTGRIIEKDPCAAYCEPGCFGYEPTCWTRWPIECPGNCPVQGEEIILDQPVAETTVHDAATPVDAMPPSTPVAADEHWSDKASTDVMTLTGGGVNTALADASPLGAAAPKLDRSEQLAEPPETAPWVANVPRATPPPPRPEAPTVLIETSKPETPRPSVASEWTVELERTSEPDAISGGSDPEQLVRFADEPTTTTDAITSPSTDGNTTGTADEEPSPAADFVAGNANISILAGLPTSPVVRGWEPAPRTKVADEIERQPNTVSASRGTGTNASLPPAVTTGLDQNSGPATGQPSTSMPTSEVRFGPRASGGPASVQEAGSKPKSKGEKSRGSIHLKVPEDGATTLRLIPASARKPVAVGDHGTRATVRFR